MPESLPPRFEILLQGYLEGTLSPNESTIFLFMLKQQPELASRLLEEIATTELLGAVVREDDLSDAGFQPPTGRARRISSRSRIRVRRAVPSHGGLGAALAAACVAIAVLAGIVFMNRTPTGGARVAGPDKKTIKEPAARDTELLKIRERMAQTEALQRAAQERLQQLEADRAKLASPVSPVSLDEQVRLQALKRLETQRAEAERELSNLAAARTNAERELTMIERKVEAAAVHQPETKTPAPAVTKLIDVGHIHFAGKVNAGAVIRRDGKREDLREGLVLHAGDRIETPKAAPGAAHPVAAALTLNLGATIDLSDDCVLELTDMHALKLNQGSLYADVEKDYDAQPARAGKYRLVIATPSASAGILGTRFELTADTATSRVRMEEGALTFFNDHGAQRVGALEESTAAATSRPSQPITISALWRGRQGASRLVTVSFQDGTLPTPQYFGTADTEIQLIEPSVNKGRDAVLEADGRSGEDEQIALLRWDLKSIARNTRVASASIVLTTTNKSLQKPYEIFEMLRHFSENNATWKHFDAGQSWEVTGADGNQDRGRKLLGTIIPNQLGSVTSNLTSDGIAAIQRWIDAPDKNHGFIIMRHPKTTDGFKFNSREAADIETRPRLNLTLLLPNNR